MKNVVVKLFNMKLKNLARVLFFFVRSPPKTLLKIFCLNYIFNSSPADIFHSFNYILLVHILQDQLWRQRVCVILICLCYVFLLRQSGHKQKIWRYEQRPEWNLNNEYVSLLFTWVGYRKKAVLMEKRFLIFTIILVPNMMLSSTSR